MNEHLVYSQVRMHWTVFNTASQVIVQKDLPLADWSVALIIGLGQCSVAYTLRSVHLANNTLTAIVEHLENIESLFQIE